MPTKCSAARWSGFFMNMVKVVLSPPVSTIFWHTPVPAGPPAAWSSSRSAAGLLSLPSFNMIRHSSTPSASTNFALPSGSSTMLVSASNRFSMYSSSSPPFSGSRLRYGATSCRIESTASNSASFRLFFAEFCTRIARISAAYCLFCPTGLSARAARASNHLNKPSSAPTTSAILHHAERAVHALAVGLILVFAQPAQMADQQAEQIRLEQRVHQRAPVGLLGRDVLVGQLADDLDRVERDVGVLVRQQARQAGRAPEPREQRVQRRVLGQQRQRLDGRVQVRLGVDEARGLVRVPRALLRVARDLLLEGERGLAQPGFVDCFFVAGGGGEVGGGRLGAVDQVQHLALGAGDAAAEEAAFVVVAGVLRRRVVVGGCGGAVGGFLIVGGGGRGPASAVVSSWSSTRAWRLVVEERLADL
ncbi:49d6793a-04ca-42fb-9328-34ffe1b5791f [Thermothielavioides terrestris]|uniref:49d6793a-04ca-42fb-9328-34ffe1b5791f n=1 Tax=Thermothielavioides terrestris TaxID=2587410 RepID=A0A446BVB9_9PEZI|nr:49d6793a-04ca-42fb-9328-34ffe1b5791f [Thermothielavioides terrestris]